MLHFLSIKVEMCFGYKISAILLLLVFFNVFYSNNFQNYEAQLRKHPHPNSPETCFMYASSEGSGETCYSPM